MNPFLALDNEEALKSRLFEELEAQYHLTADEINHAVDLRIDMIWTTT